MEISQTYWWWVPASTALPGLLSNLSASWFGCVLQLLLGFWFLLDFPHVILRAPLFCSLNRQLHPAPSSAYSVLWFPGVSLKECPVKADTYWTSVLFFAITRNIAHLYEISCRITKLPPCCRAKMLYSTSRLYIPASRKRLHPVLKAAPGTWPSIEQCLSDLYFITTSVFLLPTPASFFFLYDFALSLTSLSLPVHLSCASWWGPVSWQSKWLLGWTFSLDHCWSPGSLPSSLPSATSWTFQQSQDKFFQFHLSLAANSVAVSQAQ